MADENKPLELNTFRTPDRFRVAMYSVPMSVWCQVQAHQARQGGCIEFQAHLYSDSGQRFAAYIDVATVASDSPFAGDKKCCASASTLEELVSNLDWPHRPSELAMLRSLLATRVLTSNGELIGDRVHQRPTEAELQASRARQLAYATERIDRETEALIRETTARIQDARAEALRQAACGIAVKLRLKD